MRSYTLIYPVPIHRSFKLNKSLSLKILLRHHIHTKAIMFCEYIFSLCATLLKTFFLTKSTWSAYPTRYIRNHCRSHLVLSTVISSGSQKCCSMATATIRQQWRDFQGMIICSAFYFLQSAHSCCWSGGTVTLNARVCKQQVAQQDSLSLLLVQSALPISETLITVCLQCPPGATWELPNFCCCSCSLPCWVSHRSWTSVLYTQFRPCGDTYERQTQEGKG